MDAPPDVPRPPSERLSTGLLLVAVALPALAFSWGREGGEIAFVIYREPKLVAAAVLGWLLLAVRLWTWRAEPGLRAALRTTLRRPQVVALGVWLAYLATTGAWVRVPESFLYELNQYVLLAGLVVLLLVWTAKRPVVAGVVRAGLVTSLGVVTAVGLVQAVVPLRILTPIDPEIGAVHPSFMGYKNPAALAVLGQLFLLAEVVYRREAPAWRRGGLLVLLLAELGYLVSLGSRTSYAALAVAVAFFLLLRLARRPSLRRTLRTLGLGAGFLAVFAVALWIRPPIRGHVAYLTGRRREALAATSWGLRLHPYSPSGLRLMSEVIEDERGAARFKEAYVYVMEEASEGFLRPYPGSLP